MAETDEEKLEKSKQRAKDRIAAQRQQQADERKLHQDAIAAENAKSASELDVLLEKLPEPEQRQVRMHGYLVALNGQHDTPGNLQAHVDQQTLRLARYMVTGKV